MATRPPGFGGVAGPGDVRQPCGDGAAVGVQSLGDVAGGALRVVLEVFDDAPLDVVLALTRRGATVAGATRGRSTRRALWHHWQRDGRRFWRPWRGRAVDGALRLHCRRPPDPLEVPRDRRGNETQRVSRWLGPAGLDHGLKLRASARSRFGCFRASRAELLARRVSSTTDSTPFPGRFLGCDAVSRFSYARA